MVICLEQGADLHMAQLMPLPLTVCCFSKIQIGFTFLVPAHPGSPGKRAVKRVCVSVCVLLTIKHVGWVFKIAAVHQVRFLQFVFLMAVVVNRHTLHHRSKFHED